MSTEALLDRYLAYVRLRREVSEILHDEDGVLEAMAKESTAYRAIELVRAEQWDA